MERWEIPKPLRKAKYSLKGVGFIIAFPLGIIFCFIGLVLIQPLQYFSLTQSLYEQYAIKQKQAFGTLVVWITQVFAPTSFVISVDDRTARTSWIATLGNSESLGVKLPKNTVWVSNHQTLADGLYIWTLAYFTQTYSTLIIFLKSALRKVPIIGWGSSKFKFLFVERNWEKDQIAFQKALDTVTSELADGTRPGLCLLVFPEGTLVTGNTRPNSIKYAQKLGISDMKHALLPRSTGLYFILKRLAKDVPDLCLVDLTFAYPGPKPPYGPYWPEDYYDLTLWMTNTPPPQINVHIRVIPIADIPLTAKSTPEDEQKGKAVFEKWLINLWKEKDEMLASFLETGRLVPFTKENNAKIPIRLTRAMDVATAFSVWIYIPFWILHRMLGFRFGLGEKVQN